MGNGVILTVEDVATGLQLSRESVLRKLRDGALMGEKDGGVWYIFQKSLKSYVLKLIATRYLVKDCNGVDNNATKSEDCGRHDAHFNRYFSQEGEPQAGMLPHDAAVGLQGIFIQSACRIEPFCYHLRSDLAQEMSLAALKCQGRNMKCFYVMRGESRARDYQKAERLRGMKSIEDFEEKNEPAIPNKADCTPIVRLFKLAGIPQTVLHEYGIHLIDEERVDHAAFKSDAARGVVSGDGVPHGEHRRTRRRAPRPDWEGEVCKTINWRDSA